MANQGVKKELQTMIDGLALMLNRSLEAQEKAGNNVRNEREKEVQLLSALTAKLQQIPD